jgi:hypothetical protein
MSVIPNERHRRWIAVLVLGLLLYFLVMAALSFVDGDWLLGLVFLVLAVVLVGAELARVRTSKKASQP